MANDRKTPLDRLEDEMEKLILEASKEEILEDARAAGDDPEDFADRMRAFVEHAKREAGVERRTAARIQIDRERKTHRVGAQVAEVPRALERKVRRPDTMAARHGKALSDRDRASVEEDLDELYDDTAWGKDPDEENP
mgnify:CR=1 FL=1